MKNALDVFLALLVALFVGVFFYGAVRYPDAPYRPCAAGPFCGKGNRPHTEEQYRAFLAWQNTLIISFPFGMAASLLLGRRRRRRASQDWQCLRLVQRDLSPTIEGQRYAAAWKNLRKREIVAQVLAVFAVLAVILRAPLLFALSVFLLAAGSNLWHLLFRCPRCRHGFIRRQPRDQCPHCGLRRGTTFEQALAALNEPTSA